VGKIEVLGENLFQAPPQKTDVNWPVIESRPSQWDAVN